MEGGGKQGQKQRKRCKEGGPDLPVCAFLWSLFLAPEAYRELSPPKHRGAVLILPGTGRSVVHGETLCVLWLEAVSPLPAGYTGKLVLLLNGKARENLAKH